jgi:hypothetical protein
VAQGAALPGLYPANAEHKARYEAAKTEAAKTEAAMKGKK